MKASERPPPEAQPCTLANTIFGIRRSVAMKAWSCCSNLVNHGCDSVGSSRCADDPQIPAGAEGAAFAFDHQHPDFIRRLDLQAELLELFGDRKIDRVEGSGPVERDGGDRTLDPQQRRIVRTRDVGVIRCWHLEKSPCRDVGQLNSRSAIPRETCKMPHSFLMVKNRACATLNHEVTMRLIHRDAAKRRSSASQARSAKGPAGGDMASDQNIEPAGFHRRSVFA